jgi:hypothetical protein
VDWVPNFVGLDEDVINRLNHTSHCRRIEATVSFTCFDLLLCFWNLL